MESKKIILHSCCGPCASASTERLLNEGWDLSLYYSNNNISTIYEWEKRLDSLEKVAKKFNVDIAIDKYSHNDWLEAVKGFESEPERGARCELCFKYNLLQTSVFSNGTPITTSLTISPYKSSETIFKIGSKIDNFKEFNFKKKEGYKRSIVLSKQLELYRQPWCGCEFSKR